MMSNRILESFLTLANKTAIACAVICAAILANHSAIADNPFIILQSTTSTQNSGLYDYLLPHFSAKNGIEVRVVAVGTGQALRNAEKCDGDILITHSKTDEVKFVKNGFGTERLNLMYNDFVVLGPANDPANIASAKTVTMHSSKYLPASLNLRHVETTAARTRRKNVYGKLPT